MRGDCLNIARAEPEIAEGFVPGESHDVRQRRDPTVRSGRILGG